MLKMLAIGTIAFLATGLFLLGHDALVNALTAV